MPWVPPLRERAIAWTAPSQSDVSENLSDGNATPNSTSRSCSSGWPHRTRGLPVATRVCQHGIRVGLEVGPDRQPAPTSHRFIVSLPILGPVDSGGCLLVQPNYHVCFKRRIPDMVFCSGTDRARSQKEAGRDIPSTKNVPLYSSNICRYARYSTAPLKC